MIATYVERNPRMENWLLIVSLHNYCILHNVFARGSTPRQSHDMHCSHMHRFRQAALKRCQNFTSCRTFHDSNECAKSRYGVPFTRRIQVSSSELKISLRVLALISSKIVYAWKVGISNKRKHVDWSNELVNEKNISVGARVLILLITRESGFFLLFWLDGFAPAGHRAG